MWLGAASLCFAATTAMAGHGAEFSILAHESVHLTNRQLGNEQQRVTFDAYGRRFELLLQPNTNLNLAISADADFAPLQGTVAGLPGSWARITQSPRGWRGMFFDGTNLYAIEPSQDVAAYTVQPLNMKPGDSQVVYRLEDAVLPQGGAFCETVTPDENDQVTADSAFKSLAAELHQKTALTATKRLKVSVVADYEFASTMASPEEAMIARMNIVDGIFTSQLGVQIAVDETTVFRTPEDPFTKTKPGELLTELKRYRTSTSGELMFGATHLMTGRDMEGDTVGIAYMGYVCRGPSAASLSEAARSSVSAALIAAHEIAHNFNAPHDGEAACASTPDSYLMAARLNGNNQFSDCSLSEMQPVLDSGNCFVDIVPEKTPPASGGLITGTPPDTPSDSGGGGGRFDVLLLAVLALIALTRARLRMR